MKKMTYQQRSEIFQKNLSLMEQAIKNVIERECNNGKLGDAEEEWAAMECMHELLCLIENKSKEPSSFASSPCYVYAIKAYGNYGGGMAIVAANSEEEAMNLATGIDKVWCTKYHRPESIEMLPLTYLLSPTVINHYECGE